jgi:hypothetical protein
LAGFADVFAAMTVGGEKRPQPNDWHSEQASGHFTIERLSSEIE